MILLPQINSVGETEMGQKGMSSAFHYVLVRLTQDEDGKPIDWVGCLSGLCANVAEGYAYSAVHKDGEVVLDRCGKPGNLRLYTQHLKYEELGYFLWTRRGDPRRSPGEFPCIAYKDVTDDMLFDDPEFRTAKRTIVTLLPRIVEGKATIILSFRPE